MPPSVRNLPTFRRVLFSPYSESEDRKTWFIRIIRTEGQIPVTCILQGPNWNPMVFLQPWVQKYGITSQITQRLRPFHFNIIPLIRRPYRFNHRSIITSTFCSSQYSNYVIFFVPQSVWNSMRKLTAFRKKKQLSNVYATHLNVPGEWHYCILTSNILRIPRVSFASSISLYNPISLNMPKRLTTQRSNTDTTRAWSVWVFNIP